MHLIQIPCGQDDNGVSPVDNLWPVIGPLLEKAVEHSNGYTTIDYELGELKALRKQLWAIVTEDRGISAAGVTSLLKTSTGLLIANIELLGGDNMKAWFALKDQFETWATNEGCNEVRMFARKGWARELPDYKIRSYVMSKALV